MQVGGRQFSKWWLLLLIPLFLASAPVLLILFFAGNDLIGAIIGPPAMWERTHNSPPREELVGRYKESKRTWDRPQNGPDAMVELREDGSMEVESLPDDSITGSCMLSGMGQWSGPDEDQKLDLIVTSNGAPGSCESGSYPFMELVGHSKPYGLYWVLGDPDSGTGIWFKKQ